MQVRVDTSVGAAGLRVTEQPDIGFLMVNTCRVKAISLAILFTQETLMYYGLFGVWGGWLIKKGGG